MRKDIGKRLTNGIAARLEYEYACQKAGDFEESYLHSVMSQIVSANIDSTHSMKQGYPHPAIAAIPQVGQKLRGRPREVDFFVQPWKPAAGQSLCIEAKWADSAHASTDNIFYDLCRLMLVKEQSESAECLFVLAGTASWVAKRINDLPLASLRGRQVRLLQPPNERKYSRPRTYPIVDKAGNYQGPKSLAKLLPTPPEKIASTLIPSSLQLQRYRSIVWRIGKPPGH